MFVCIENNKVTSILEYQPNVPSSVSVVQITKEQYQTIQDRTHYFDAVTQSVKKVPQNEIAKETLRQKGAVAREYLNSTDWMVLRHVREKALGITTTLTQDTYIDLERQRQQAADSI